MQLEIGSDLRGAFDQVEAVRKANGISQAELARTARLSEATYNKLLRNTDRTPFRRTVLKLRDALAELTGEVPA